MTKNIKSHAYEGILYNVSFPPRQESMDFSALGTAAFEEMIMKAYYTEASNLVMLGMP